VGLPLAGQHPQSPKTAKRTHFQQIPLFRLYLPAHQNTRRAQRFNIFKNDFDEGHNGNRFAS
jgi:hypothetical protein